MKILVCWVGNTDLRAGDGEEDVVGQGPIAQALAWDQFHEVVLLANQKEYKIHQYAQWLKQRFYGKITPKRHELTGPTDFGEIYKAATQELDGIIAANGDEVDLTYHLSPGTPAMAAVWIIIAKTRFSARLIESSKEGGVKEAKVPFDITAEFIPDLLRRPDRKLVKLSTAKPDEASQFDSILYKSPQMEKVVAMAKKVAIRSIPVLIEGESGTGKELMARAIHNSSARRDKPFIAINCGAIPENLVESELFGHKRGAFTGAEKDRVGHFEKADGGTIFLDEIGELPKAAQVKLLRVLQENEVQRVGESESRKINVRVISATNRALLEEIAKNEFREDLFYRLAVAIIRLPALRERDGDLMLLVDHLMNKINMESEAEQPGYKCKKIYKDAINVIQKHGWPGNIRELLNTLQRAAVWSDEPVIDEEIIRKSILKLPATNNSGNSILDRNINQGIDLKSVIGEVSTHYIKRALEKSGGNKSKAAGMLGFSSHQTLSGWMRRSGIE